MRWLPDSFRHRLVVFIAIISLLVAVPVYGYIDYVHGQQLVRDRGLAMQDLAKAVATVVAENLTERQREIQRLADTPLLREAPLDSPAISDALQRLQDSYPHYSWIGLADTQGFVQAASGDLLVGVSVAERPWFKQGLEGPYVGDLHEALLLAKLLPDESTDAPIRFIDFTSPVQSRDGNLRGVLGAHAHWRWAEGVIGAVTPLYVADAGIDIFLVDQTGQIVYPETDSTPGNVPVTIDSVSTEPGFMTWPDAGGDFLTTTAAVRNPIPDEPLDWRVVVRQPQHIMLADLRALQRVIVMAAILAGLLFLAVAWILARRLSRPLEQLATTARRIERGDEHIKFHIEASSAELRELVAALRGMAATLVSRKQALETTNQQLEAMVEARTAELARANAELTELARHDTLTGLPNRRAIDGRLHDAWARWQRLREPFAVLVIDIDHFKRVNDTYGHAEGDAVLREVASRLRGRVRETDLCGRQGGEEFLVILSASAVEAAREVAEAMRTDIAQCEFPHIGRLTVSVGIAQIQPGDEHPEQPVQRADEALYGAKQAGRNCVHPPAGAA